MAQPEIVIEYPPGEEDFSEEELVISTVAYEPESGNLVESMEKDEEGEKLLKEIAARVREDFDIDWESSSKFREKVEADLKLFVGELRQKSFPFDNCANPNVPMMLENLSRLQARFLSEIMGDWTNVVGVHPVGEDDQNLADLLTMHTNWQFREQIKDFRRQCDRAALAFLLIGDVVWYSYYDEVRRCNRHVALTPDEFVTPYTYISTMPDLSDLPHYTHVLRMYPNELEAMVGIWSHVDKVLDMPAEGHEDEPDGAIRRGIGEVQGQEEPVAEESTPYKILQYEGWLKLPGGDRHRWCRVVMHDASDTIMSLKVHEEPDWRDKRRLERQRMEKDLYLQAYGEWSRQDSERRSAVAGSEMVVSDPVADPLSQDDAMAELMASRPAPEPVRPSWMRSLESEPEPLRMVPTHMYAHGVCLENLLGNIGMGMGRIQADLNRTINTLMAQYIDAATLANCWSIIVAGNVRFEGADGAFSMKPGKINRAIGVSGVDLKSNIIELRPQQANTQMVEMVDKFYQYGQAAIQAPNVLSGEPGKSGETYRGIATRIEQATKQLSIIAQRFSIPLKQVYENNAKLNSIFMEEQEFHMLLNHMTRKLEPQTLARRMYERDFRVEFRSDMKFTSEAQRISEADQLVDLAGKHPALASNFAFQHEAIREALEARGKHKYVQLLGGRPPVPSVFGPPPPPPGNQAAPPPGKPPGGKNG